MAKAGTSQNLAHSAGVGNDAAGPGRSVHPLVIRAAVVASVWFVIVMAISFSGTTEADYLFFGVTVAFSIIFFTLVLGLAAFAARRARGGGSAAPFGDFLHERVSINTGSVSGKEAMIQVLMLPVALAIGATIIGAIFIALG
jgi:hypothetical protein